MKGGYSSVTSTRGEAQSLGRLKAFPRVSGSLAFSSDSMPMPFSPESLTVMSAPTRGDSSTDFYWEESSDFSLKSGGFHDARDMSHSPSNCQSFKLSPWMTSETENSYVSVQNQAIMMNFCDSSPALPVSKAFSREDYAPFQMSDSESPGAERLFGALYKRRN